MSARKQDVVRMSAPVVSEAVGVLKVLMMVQHFTLSFAIQRKNPRALMHSILKMPQTQSLKPLEKFLGDQQVSPIHSTGDSPGWLMTHPASASLDTGGEMNKCIKPWVSRRRALGQTKARLEISVLQHKENGNESVRLCMAKRESKNGTR